MRVIGTKADPAVYDGVAEAVWPPEATLEVCRQADVLMVALPGGPETTGLVGAEELDALGPGWLVNVGRGSVVDEAALIEALTEGELRGAGLDVFETEPPAGSSPLWDLPHVIVSPHCAGATPRYAAKLAGLFEANLEAFWGRAPWVSRFV